MRKLRLDGKKMLNREIAHKYLKSRFNFPSHYGANLDALWDCLNEIDEMELYIRNKDYIIINLNEYGYDLIETFQDYTKKNDKFILRIKN